MRPARIRWTSASACSASRACCPIRPASPMRCAASTPAACAACSSWWPRNPAGAAQTLPKGTGMGVGVLLQPSRLFRRGRAGDRRAVGQRSRSTRSGSPAMSAARSSIPASAENQVQGAALDGIGAALGQAITIDRGRVVQANFDTRAAAAHRSGAAGRGAFPDHRPSADRSRRAGAAAGHSGAVQRDLRRDRQAHPQPADRLAGAEGLRRQRRAAASAAARFRGSTTQFGNYGLIDSKIRVLIFSPPTNHALSEVVRLLAAQATWCCAGASRFPEIAAKRTRRRARRGWRFR